MTSIKNWLRASLLLATVLFASQGAVGHTLGGRTAVVLADTPACGNGSHNTAAGTFACSNGPDGNTYKMLCNGNLRQGPELAYATHGTATGTGIDQYRDVVNGAMINGMCGGTTTSHWYLSSNGWVSHSITS